MTSSATTWILSDDAGAQDRLLHRFQALAEETRLQIVQLLTGGELCVCEIQDELNAAQSRLSFHLGKLRDAGVVSGRKEGRWIYYSLNPEVLEEMRSFLSEVKPRRPSRRDGRAGA